MNDELDIGADTASATEGLSGEASVGENAGYYAQILAFRVLDKLAERVYRLTVESARDEEDSGVDPRPIIISNTGAALSSFTQPSGPTRLY